MSQFLPGPQWFGIIAVAITPWVAAGEVGFEIQVETVMEHDDGKFLWYHPRASAVDGEPEPEIIMTLQKHLHVSDYYSGLYVLRRKDAKWSGPDAVPELDWRKESPSGSERVIAVADVTPGWHAPTGKLLAIGCEVPYSPAGEQLDDKPRQHQTAYAVYDPKTRKWRKWRRLEVPERFNFCRSACSQWLVRSNGLLLVPVYFGDNAQGPWSVAVFECRFEGERLSYVRHGNELSLKVQRGLAEPSIAAFRNGFYLTIRNDRGGYVSKSRDGLTWEPIRPWRFDDGSDLGSYNTQQHWLVHSEGLFLVYTRRGASNDHIIRHRAPLFIARVDPETCHVLKASERTLLPERGGELGNFGCAAITSRESWVTVSEGVWSDDARRRGAKGATFVARVIWSKPNGLAPVRQPPHER